MPTFHLTRKATADFQNITSYTLQTWGEAQALRYAHGIEDCMQLLADNPELGQEAEEIRPGLRRMQHAKHVILYTKVDSAVLILRILHKSMMPRFI